ncbi:MAG: hypothetical protein GX778_06780, partial [Erysipelothrix sp.]|nr:hypothetical protein [Erysipelothrix sp.]
DSINPINEEKTFIGTTVTNEYLNGVLEISSDKNNLVGTQALNLDSYKTKSKDVLDQIEQFDAHIYKLRDLYTDEELSEYFDYTESQIEGIRYFDGTDEMRIQASATTTLYLYHYNYSYNSSTNKTTISLETNGYINGIPFLEMGGRTISLGAVGSSALFMMDGSPYLNAYYQSQNGQPPIYYNYNSSNVSKKTFVGLGVSMAFPRKIGKTINTGLVHSWSLKQFTARYHGIATGNVNVAGIRSSFAYRKFKLNSPTIGISIGKNVGASISITVHSGWALEADIVRTVMY